MAPDQLDFLKSHLDARVEIRCRDGEVMIVTLLAICEDEEDIVYDLHSSNRQERYGSFPAEAVFATPFDAIEVVRLLPN